MSNLKKILPLLFIFMANYCFSQNLKFIPDSNLRKALAEQNFTTNDSLDLTKINGLLQLQLGNKNIENLDGLQYFERVWGLTLYRNKLKTLKNLPPNVTTLSCDANELEIIDCLPKSITNLSCSNNNITRIKNLPNSLISLNCSNNKLTKLPALPPKLQYINYSNNPIKKSALPLEYQKIDCNEINKNCLPLNKISWNILNSKFKNSNLDLLGMEIKIAYNYSWGFGSETKTTLYEKLDDNLYAKKIENKRRYNRIVEKDKNDTITFEQVNYVLEISKIKQLLKDIYDNNLNVFISDSTKNIDLRKINNSTNFCASNCADCTYYDVKYTFFCKADTIQMYFSFDSSLYEGPSLCPPKGSGNIKTILDWLYLYKLTNLTLHNDELNSVFFNTKNIDKIRKWAE